MKKILSLFVVAGALGIMVGCDDKKPATTAATTKTTTETKKTEETKAPAKTEEKK